VMLVVTRCLSTSCYTPSPSSLSSAIVPPFATLGV
jgi:hypothetical protein